MNADAKETLVSCAANLAVIAAAMRKVGSDPDFAATKPESDGLEVLATTLDAMATKGIDTVCNGGGEK